MLSGSFVQSVLISSRFFFSSHSTKNTICVHIRGRDCQNLSIVDLPGLIQSVDKKEDERYIHLVEGLVKEYLQSDKTVILQCFQSDEDIEVGSI